MCGSFMMLRLLGIIASRHGLRLRIDWNGVMAQAATAPLETLTEDVYAELVAEPIERYLSVQRKDWEADRPFGLWQYGVHGDYVALHILNVYMPDSPFAHGAEIFAALDRIIQEIDHRGLKIVRIGVDSWINSLPPYPAVFPGAVREVAGADITGCQRVATAGGDSSSVARGSFTSGARSYFAARASSSLCARTESARSRRSDNMYGVALKYRADIPTGNRPVWGHRFRRYRRSFCRG